MRFEELFENLGHLAGTFASQMRHAVVQGVPLAELDLTGTAPSGVALIGPTKVEVRTGEVFRVEIEGPAGDDVRFAPSEDRLGISGGDHDTVVRVTLPTIRKLELAGSGRMSADGLARDGEISLAGSGRLELAAVGGGRLSIKLAGSARLTLDGHADELELSIAGSGSCDGEGLTVGKAAVHIAGSGDAIFACNGEVSASLMGSGNVIVRGSARCSVNSMGSGTLVCERDKERAH
jgi:putative autotransporter adhesin-like protein